MNLQDTFYIMGIVFMTLSILMLIGIVVLLFYIKKKIADIHEHVELKLDELADFAVSPVKKAVHFATSFFPGGPKRTKSRK